jgi:hypothetical protein
MKIIVAVIVYNRLDNLQEWCRCWNLCEKENTELIIIHNFDNVQHKVGYEQICKLHNITYVPRLNVGMDIGALQDVFRGALEGFPNEWDYLLWSTDDVIPMNKQFIPLYLDQIKTLENEKGVVCLEISKEFKPHIRTTGFMIDQVTASGIHFPVSKILTKDQCWEFEHRSKDSFLEQVQRMNKKAIQIFPALKDSCMWDTHSRQDLNRWEEHYNQFPK